MLILGIGALIALSIILAGAAASKYGGDSYRFRAYLLAVIVGFFLIAPGTFRLLAHAGWFHRGTTSQSTNPKTA
jgi:hypothetical protein